MKVFFEQDEEKKKANLETAIEYFPFWVSVYEKRLNSNSDKSHLVGSKLTIADFAVVTTCYNVFLNEANPIHSHFKPILEKNEVFHNYVKSVREELKEFFEKRPVRPF